MSAPSSPIAIGALDLAALLCSRVCHDLISPVGAIVNGLEVMEEDKDEATKTFALDLSRRVPNRVGPLAILSSGVRRGRFFRSPDRLGDAEKVTRGLMEDDKTKIAWNLPRAS